VAIGLEFARPLLHAAALSLGDGALGSGALGSGALGEAARDVSAAKVACADAAYLAARAALQVHGAIGYTEEHDLSLWLTKIRALLPTWGTQSDHRARVLKASLRGASTREFHDRGQFAANSARNCPRS